MLHVCLRFHKYIDACTTHTVFKYQALKLGYIIAVLFLHCWTDQIFTWGKQVFVWGYLALVLVLLSDNVCVGIC